MLGKQAKDGPCVMASNGPYVAHFFAAGQAINQQSTGVN